MKCFYGKSDNDLFAVKLRFNDCESRVIALFAWTSKCYIDVALVLVLFGVDAVSL